MLNVQDFIDRGILIDPEVAKKQEWLQAANELMVQRPDCDIIDEQVVLEYLATQKKTKELFLAVDQTSPAIQTVQTTNILSATPAIISDTTAVANPISTNSLGAVQVVSHYVQPGKKRTIEDFIARFNLRFSYFENILRQRAELGGLTSITRLKTKSDRERVAIIAMIMDRVVTEKNHVILTLEDPTGTVKALVAAGNTVQNAFAKDLILDDVIGVSGTWSREMLMVDSILLPDVPAHRELRKGPEEEYVVFVGDLHVGNKEFLKQEFEKMLTWLSGRVGPAPMRELAAKVKYVCFMGDLVEGVGVYPNHERDLNITDIYDQYRAFSEYVKRIPNDKQIIIIPGNHDVGRIAEPQPAIPKLFVPELHDQPHIHFLSNPCSVNIGAKPGFDGFEVLLYHGYSLIYYADNVESIRSQGGMKRVDLVMEMLLRRRHLAPSHGSNLYVPDGTQDALLLSRLPDIFVTGHIHRTSVRTFRGTTLINASAWVGETDYQTKVGLIPQPARLPIINLKTREVKILNFLGEEK